MNEPHADKADESALLPALKQRLAVLRQHQGLPDRDAVEQEIYLCRLFNRIRKRTPHGLGDLEIPQLS